MILIIINISVSMVVPCFSVPKKICFIHIFSKMNFLFFPQLDSMIMVQSVMAFASQPFLMLVKTT